MGESKRQATPAELEAAKNPEAHIRTRVAAALMGIKTATLRKWVHEAHTGKGPGRPVPEPFYRGRSVYFRAGDIHSWLANTGERITRRA